MMPNAFPDVPANAGQSPFIELRQVIKSFKNAAGEYTVLKGVDAVFYQSQFVSIVGRSGSGKSTLLNMMTGIDHPTSGTVRVGDTILSSMDEGRMAVWRGRQMGIVFQFFQLLPMLTLLENVMLPMDFADRYGEAERETRALDLLKMVGLDGLEHKYPAAVSGGQQQTAAVARALANDPPILVADEPTGNLDTRTAARVLEIFEEQVALGKTVIMVTHDNTLANHAPRKLVLSDGELVNEWISRAFPALRHGTLLRLSHAARPHHYPAGETLFERDRGPALMLVTAGEADLLTAPRIGKTEASGCLGPGMLFSQADVRGLGRSFSALKAREALDALVIETLPDVPDLPPALEAAAQARSAETQKAPRDHPSRWPEIRFWGKKGGA